MEPMASGRMIVCWSLRVVLASVFVGAGLMKLSDPQDVVNDMSNYRLLPNIVLAPASALLPWLEIVAGVGLLTSHIWRGGAIVLGTLLLIFVIAIASASWRGLDIRCGCFGTDSPHAAYAWLLLRDLGLLGMLVGLYGSLSGGSAEPS